MHPVPCTLDYIEEYYRRLYSKGYSLMKKAGLGSVTDRMGKDYRGMKLCQACPAMMKEVEDLRELHLRDLKEYEKLFKDHEELQTKCRELEREIAEANIDSFIANLWLYVDWNPDFKNLEKEYRKLRDDTNHPCRLDLAWDKYCELVRTKSSLDPCA